MGYHYSDYTDAQEAELLRIILGSAFLLGCISGLSPGTTTTGPPSRHVGVSVQNTSTHETQLTGPAGVAKASVLVESNSPPTRHFARERTVLEKGPNEAAKPVLGDARAGVAAVVRVS